MPSKEKSLPKKKPKGLHRWKNFPPDDKLAEKMEKKVLEFEDSTSKLRMEIAKKFNVRYHSCYFTRELIPNGRKN